MLALVALGLSIALGLFCVLSAVTAPRQARAPAVQAIAPSRAAAPDPGPAPATATPTTQPARVDGPLVLYHPTCGQEALAPDGGLAFPDGGTHYTGLSCATPDGGVQWTIRAGQPRDQAVARMIASMLMVSLRQMDQRERQRELRRMDEESRRHDRSWANPGMLFRAPERVSGRLVRLEGTVQRVVERDGDTVFTLVYDLVARERVAVTYPGIAGEDVVNGADVVVYAIATGSHSRDSVYGQIVVPEVIATHVEVQPEGADEERADRMLRRARH